jgi:hypothetical protein
MRASVAVFVVSIAVYVRTLHPSIAGGDSAEFVNCSYSLTVGHPPGYPLFLIITALFSRLFLVLFSPLARALSGSQLEFAWAANLVSAVFSALANAALCETVHFLLLSRARLCRDKKNDDDVVVDDDDDDHNNNNNNNNNNSNNNKGLLAWLASVSSSLLFGFSPLVWRYSIHAEVFSLNNLLAALLLYSLVRYSDAGSSGERLAWAKRGALLCGLGASNQHTLSLMAIPIAAFAVARGVASEGWRGAEMLAVSGRFVAGLGCYVYLVVVDMPKPLHSWGDMGSVTGLFNHFVRADYGSLSLAPEGGQIAKLGSTYTMWYAIGVHLADFAWKQTPLVAGPPLAAAGAWAMLRGSRLERVAVRWIFALALIYLLVFNSLANLPLNSDLHAGIMARFYMQPNLLAFALIGAGIDALLRVLVAASRGGGGGGSAPRAVLAVALLCGWQVVRSFHEMDQSGNFAIKAFGLGHLALLPENAILLTSGDVEYGSIRYAQDVLGFRTDVAFMETTLALKPWYRTDPRIRVPGARKANGKHSTKRRGTLGKDFGMAHVLVMNHRPEEGSFVYVSGGSRPQPTLERVLEDPSLRNGRWEGFPFGFSDVIVDTRDGQLPIDEALEDLYKAARAALPGLDGSLDRDTIVLPLLDIDLKKYRSDSWEYMVAQRVTQCYHRLSWMLLFYADVRGYRHDGAILKASREAIEPLLARDRLPYPVASYMLTNYLRLVKDPGFDAIARDHIIENTADRAAWATELERQEKEAGRWDGLSEPTTTSNDLK